MDNLNDLRNAFDDYAAQLASSASNVNRACEARRNPTIIETVARNRDKIDEINRGVDGLLELLVGPENSENRDVMKPPTCLQDEVTAQNIILGDIYAKLNRAYAALNG